MQSRIITVILQTLDKAKRQAMREFESLHKVKIYEKSEGNYVSDADYKVEKIIIDELQRAIPGYNILSEEAGHIQGSAFNPEGYFEWVIDPIDGTSNFLRGGHYWCIAIALKKVIKGKAEIIAGGISAPVLGDVYWAEVGKGAYLVDSNSQQMRLRVSERKKLKECCFATSMHLNKHSNSANIIDIIHNNKASLRVCGATALDMALLAKGRYDIVFSYDTKEWDIAAGIVIAKEAGAILRDYDNENAYLQKLNLIASNGNLINFEEV
jgi:myo-inositol-1(or 4)-monophosphatase